MVIADAIGLAIIIVFASVSLGLFVQCLINTALWALNLILDLKDADKSR